MPILFEKDPLQELLQVQDPGLEYLEWQKSWSHRTHWEMQSAIKFVLAQNRHEEPSCRPKSFDHAPQIFLPLYNPEAEFIRRKMMSDIIQERRTCREGELGGSPSFQQLGAMLQIGYGSKWPPGLERFTPSPGGLYTLEVYVWWPGSDEIPRGIYHYHPLSHVFERFHHLPENFRIEDIVLPDTHANLQSGCGLVFVTSVLGLMKRKYGAKYLRFCMIEAGVALQSFYLAGCHLGIGIWPQGFFFEDELNRLLLINGLDEAVLSGFIFGTESNRNS